MNFRKLNVFQKINYYLVFFLGLSFIGLLIAAVIDFYVRYIAHQWDSEYQSTFIQTFAAISLIQLFVICPNAFTIYVHEMRKQIQPPIPFAFTLTKNIFIGLVIALVLIPIIIYPFLKSFNPSETIEITKHLIGKRHHSIATDYADTVLYTIMTIVFFLPAIGVINWFHAITWKGIVYLNRKFN